MILRSNRLEEVLSVGLPRGVEVTGVTHNSRAVRPGFAFVAVPGFRRDGAEFAKDALGRGAALVVAERKVSAGPSVVVPDARAALADLACAVFGDPSEELEVYGVTGTNGKTTTSYVLYSVLTRAYGAEACGLMTTAETIYAGERHPAGRTTPEAPEVQETLSEMLEKGVKKIVMEVSSHGIALKRVAGTRFAGALFTNLTRDHLDLHGTMEEYYETKRELFYMARGPKLSNADDPWGRRLSTEVEDIETFGEKEGADYRVEDVCYGPKGTTFSLRHPGGDLEIKSPLLGGYNALNVAGAAALALSAGVEEVAVGRAVREMPQVPGRFERVVGAEGFEVIVDYAHTDVGLSAVLEVARAAARGAACRAGSNGRGGRVICVFGAAGDRDGAKRPLMGRAAAELADRSIITTDDAYSEDPARIAREVAAGADPERTEILLDRRKAIRRALREAEPGDVVVVAGKGHERVQHLPDGDVPFHDASVVRELLNELGEKRG
ncbi:MAG: UDP-N-acetylmuramoyl-L-alanyl-D-glutamate--2,6-diaminopimelate ligase [Actinomycetota bacterium]|nr:UDP-N-acetylmuramoyl-L-alanyl-D-glutamate--2,6-diaminopimelate ligase [Actinomycetota bacterium]HZY66290.1 UDP-N-acetylmuramoyl-L-alanyl-D-glutamate--2,6-diaminopimelate ligase [Rubrobacteraceae bacterium]